MRTILRILLLTLLLGCTFVPVKGQSKSDVVTLKEYVDTRLTALEKSTALTADQLNTRLIGMNEFRQALTDQSKTYFTRSEHVFFAEKIEADIRILRESKATLEGKASQTSVDMAIMLAAISILATGVNAVILWTTRRHATGISDK